MKTSLAAVPKIDPIVALGDTVLYVDPHMGDSYPAIVTRIVAGTRVMLSALPPNVTPFAVRGTVEYSADKTAPGTYYLRG